MDQEGVEIIRAKMRERALKGSAHLRRVGGAGVVWEPMVLARGVGVLALQEQVLAAQARAHERFQRVAREVRLFLEQAVPARDAVARSA